MKNELLDRISELQKALAAQQCNASEQDCQKWNANLQKAAQTDEQVQAIRKELDSLNADQIRADIMKINAQAHQFALKIDLEPVMRKQVQIKGQLDDMDYAVKKVEPMVRDLDSRFESM